MLCFYGIIEDNIYQLWEIGKMNIKYFLFIAFLFCIPSLVFLFRLDRNPPGFFIDESINGYEAYTLLKTKGFSSSGEFLPRLFNKPGDLPHNARNHHAFIYMIIPFVAFFGLNELSVRLVSVFASIMLICLISIIAMKKVSFGSIALGIIWWPATAWVFLISRVGMEFMVNALVYTMIVYLIMRIYERKAREDSVYLLGILMGIYFYIYVAGKLLAAVLGIITIFILFVKKYSARSIIILMVIYLTIGLLARKYVIESSFFFRLDEAKKCGNSPIHCLINSIGTHLNPQSYFADSFYPLDFPNSRHSISNTSLIPRILAPFLILGLLVILRGIYRKDFFSVSLFGSFIIAMFPASFLTRGFDSFRSSAILPIIYIFTILGFNVFLKLIKKLPKKIYILAVGVIVLLFGLFWQKELKILFDYEYQTQAAKLTGWQYGYRDIFQYFLQHYNEYKKFVLTKSFAYDTYFYPRFYDPEGFYGKIKVGSFDKKSQNNKILYALRREEVPSKEFIIKKIIYYPNGIDEAFYIGGANNRE